MNMARRSSSGTPTQPKAGVLTEIGRNAQLVWRLLTDHRVSLLTKLVIPGLMAGYLLWPIDLMPDVVPLLGQLDDLALLALGIKLFIELCPKEIVREYRGEAAGASATGQVDESDTVDVEYRVVQ